MRYLCTGDWGTPAVGADCDHVTEPRALGRGGRCAWRVFCCGCDFNEGCWSAEHVSEEMWNLACKNDSSFVPCEQSRAGVCAICGETFVTGACP